MQLPCVADVQGHRATAAAATVAVLAGLAKGLAVKRHAMESQAARAAAKKKGGGKGGGKDSAEAASEDEGAATVDTAALMSEYQEKMDKSLEVLRQGLVGIRAGKATPALVEGLKVKAYDSEVPIKDLASISATDSTTLLITCFDESVAPAVEKAVITSDMGYTAQQLGPNIKVSIPPMTKDKRTQFVKLAKESAEKCRVAVRNVRQAAMKKVKGLKGVSEDVVRSLQDEVEELVKKNIAECDRMAKKKEDELMTV